MDPVVGRLLAGRAQLSVVEKDAVIARVLAATTPSRGRSWWAMGIGVGALAVAAIVVLLIIDPTRPRPDHIASRGSSERVMRVVCAGTGELGTCGRGDKLLFDLAAGDGQYFAAFAERPDGSVIWYVPATSDGQSVVATPGVLEVGVRLADDHPPGTYRVHGIFSTRPLTRDEIKNAVMTRSATVIDDVRTLEVTR